MSKVFRVIFLTALLPLIVFGQKKTLDIYWIDVEGGAATLIVTPGGESILIDAGENLDRDSSRINYVATKIAGLRQIDYFVATHYHADHYGGTYKVNQLLPIKKFYDHGNIPSRVPEDFQFSVLMPLYLKATQGRSIPLRPGDFIPVKQSADGPGLTIECVGSSGEVAPLREPDLPKNPACENKTSFPIDETDNANSLVLRLKYGNFVFLDGGDLTLKKEEQLVCPVNRIGQVDLFQIDHHGLDLSNNPVLISTIQPRVVIINNGPRKGAEPNTMKTLKATEGIETIWQMHRNLSTGPQLNTDPKYIANWDAECAECNPKFIKASVQSDGTFSVQINPDGTRQEYKAKRNGY